MTAGEGADDHAGVVAVLSDCWRVITSCGIQWVLQRRDPTERLHKASWRGRSFCRTREALLRVCRLHARPADPGAMAILEALPERFPERAASGV